MTAAVTVTVTLQPADDALAVLRAIAGDSVVVVIRPCRDATALAMARAAIVALASERAPGRINAVQPGAETAAAEIDGAVAYLANAPAVTAQIIELA